MSPENVERGRRPVFRENSRGPGRRSVAIFFVPICLIDAGGALVALANLLICCSLNPVRAAALRTSFSRRLDKSRPPLPSWADVKDGRVRPGHDVKAGATPSHLRSGKSMADGGDKGRGGD